MRLLDHARRGVRGAVRRRALWHQRLIEAEGGFRIGLRTSSILYVHAFVACLIIVSGAVLGLPPSDWLWIGMGIAAVIAAELFNAALQVLANELAPGVSEAGRQVRRLSTAATLTTVLAALVIAVTVLARHVGELTR